MNAFVEIVLDNSDHRLALEHSDEVVLRRTIGLKKDEFFLQRKRCTKQEVQSLLEGAGLSRSNPYYMVQQGKIQALCTMTDGERLRLLKEVAGTTVYDQKKQESVTKMTDNQTQLATIATLLDDIQDRLEQLQAEKDELDQYRVLDRQRRALAYTLYDQEVQKARQVLDQLQHERSDHAQALADLHQLAKDSHTQIRNTEALVQQRHKQCGRQQQQTERWLHDQTQALTHLAQLQVACRELQDSVAHGETTVEQNAHELERLQVELQRVQKQLETDVQPSYDAAQSHLLHLQTTRDDLSRHVAALWAKQGRGRQFSSVADRDAFVQSQLDEQAQRQSDQQASLQQFQDQLASLRRTLAAGADEVTALQVQLVDKSKACTELSHSRDVAHRERQQVAETRKEHWRLAEECHDQVREAKEAFHKASAEWRKTMPKATALGIEALQKIVQEEGLSKEQYFGMVMENLELKDAKFQTAVEVAAQNALFHVIVDTDATASKLLTRLEKDKLGRVTFLPLNQLRTETMNYPQSNDFRPLLDLCVSYDPRVSAAMKHVFSKKLLARSPEVAAEWSSKLSVDAITLDGDLCSRKGALTGGYVDSAKSRLRAFTSRQEAAEQLATAEQEYQTKNREAQVVDQKATELQQETQRMETKLSELRRMIAAQEKDVERKQARLENQKKQMEEIEKSKIPPVEREIASLESDMKRLQEELGTPLTQTLSDEDRALLQKLKEQQASLVEEISKQSDVVSRVGIERQKLESLLNDNLRKRFRELTDGESGRANPDGLSAEALLRKNKEELSDRQRELDDAMRVKDEIENRLQEARKAEEEMGAALLKAKNDLEKLRTKDEEAAKALEEAQDKSERLLNTRSTFMAKRATYLQKIQELGSLPPPTELEKYTGKSIADLMKSLDQVNKKLKKYSHVNKKAFDQYVNFSEQRDSLLKRKEELDQGADKVKELIESLDRQKDEAINRTFRGVSAHFKDVFKELVPNGAGELIMKTAMDATAEDETDAEDAEEESSSESPKKKADPKNPDVSLYRGIGIKVRFSAVGENFMMSQLSGGQKALVALALIFAIQRCDPAPFYIFDELDQALDSTYRNAVAEVIQRQANSTENPTQFIGTFTLSIH